MADPQQGAPSPYLSTDPNAGLAATPPPATSPASPYLSTDPRAGLPSGGGGGRGGGPGLSTPATTGRGGRPASGGTLAPPPRTPFYPGGARAAAEDFAGMVGGGLATAAATAALPEIAPVAGVGAIAKMLPGWARAARAGIGIAGAGTAGGATALATGAPLDVSGPGTGAEDEDSAVGAFKRQAEMEAAGLGVGWIASALGRRVLASGVASKAREWLEATRQLNLDDVRGVFQRAQDALRVHAESGALARQARTEATTALGETAQQAKTEARGAFGAATAAKEAAGPRIEGIQAKGATIEGAQRGQWPTGEVPVGGAGARAATPPPMAPVAAHTPGAPAGPPGPRPPAPSPAALAAGKVEQVVSGPAQSSLDKLGKAVESAAESGPAVRFSPIQAQLQAMHAAIAPKVLAEPAGAIPADIRAQFGPITSDTDIRRMLALSGVELEPSHPLPGVLGQMMSVSEEQIPFADAHRFKRLLDEAIGWKPAGAIRAPARTQLKQITKGIRGQLRAEMAGHAPYDEATAAYADASKLFGPQGLARKIQAAAVANPDALVNSLVKPTEPTKLQMLKEVLIHHAEAGGGEEGAQAGRQAWQAVQSSVMYKHLIQPGIDNFDRSVAKMHPEFLHTLTSDPEARGVFSRLQEMSEAVKSTRSQTAREIVGVRRETAATAAAHKATGQAARGRQFAAEAQRSTLTMEGQRADAQHAVEGTQLSTARQQAGRDVQAARQPTPAERAFAKSSLSGGQQPQPAQVGAETAYAALAPIGSPRQAAGFTRLVLRGPRVNDLIQWASLSPTTTRMFVRAATSPMPGQAIAAMIRLQDWMNGATAPELAVGHQQAGQGGQGGGQAPAATPPPGPRR